MLKDRMIVGALVGAALVGWCAESALALRVCTYNLLQYNGSGSSSRTAYFQDILNEIQPDILVAQEVTSITAANYFKDQVLNGAGGPGGYSRASFHDSGTGLSNACFYRSAVVSYVGYTWVPTSPRDTDRWMFRPFGYSSSAADFYIYSMHLHSSDAGSRETQTETVRTHANNLPSNTHFLYVGDFNIDSSSEASYQNLVGSQADNDGLAWDPLFAPGPWHDNGSFDWLHTQSTYDDDDPGPPGGAGGGLDDRFDFQLASSALIVSEGMDYVTGSYRAFGNDGNHFNNDITDPPEIPEGAAIATALHGASDHLPVRADYQVHAVIVADELIDFGTVVQGTPAEEMLTVANDGDLALFTYVDDLDYSMGASAGFTAPAGSFSVEADEPADQQVIEMDTSTVGPKSGTVTVSSDDPDTPEFVVQLTGEVISGGPIFPFDDDGDGDVDLNDYQGFNTCLLGPGGGAVSPCDNHDSDTDNDVDLEDFMQFQLHFTG